MQSDKQSIEFLYEEKRKRESLSPNLDVDHSETTKSRREDGEINIFKPGDDAAEKS